MTLIMVMYDAQAIKVKVKMAIRIPITDELFNHPARPFAFRVDSTCQNTYRAEHVVSRT